MEEQPTQHAVVFADVCGSTHLYEAFGDKRALECIALCFDIMRHATLEHGGRVVKTIGDEAMCVFPDASAAARAACEMQNRVGMQDPIGSERLAIRIGAHYGPTIEQAGDLYGDAVNVAARMASLAKAGQIITTHEFVDRLTADLRTMTRSLDSFSVKGKLEEIAIYELLAQRSEEVTTLVKRPAEKQLRVRLRHGGRETYLEGDRRTASFGRDASGDFIIEDKKASRQHARVERRRDKYVLVDMSSNGTYVTFQGQPEIALRREEVVLYGRGSISFGHRYADDPTEVVAFEVE